MSRKRDKSYLLRVTAEEYEQIKRAIRPHETIGGFIRASCLKEAQRRSDEGRIRRAAMSKLSDEEASALGLL